MTDILSSQPIERTCHTGHAFDAACGYHVDMLGRVWCGRHWGEKRIADLSVWCDYEDCLDCEQEVCPEHPIHLFDAWAPAMADADA